MHNVPENLRYTKSHEWILIEGDIATVGITDHAQAELTDVVFVETPEKGKAVDAGQPTAVVESVKAASDIYAPVSGEIIEGNDELAGEPALINTDPYSKGWIFKIKMSHPGEVNSLMSPNDYTTSIG